MNAKQKVLAAAEELFAEQGYDATSVQQVVDRAGVTKGAMYHYFSSKEDLLFDLYHELFVEQLAGLDRIVAQQTDPVTTIREIIDDLVITTAARTRAVTIFGREGSRFLGKERFLTLQTEWRRYQDTVRKVIRDAQLSGEFTSAASPEVISWAIFGFTNDLHTWYRPDGPKPPAVIAKELTDFVLNGLMAKEQA
ncbi:TetR/AcrR family transcriptional regulator [Catelliglobosispora koreensis]|uniref:TetR/AcrR family transcriptional regulator n=1 Tax=Catelliglobosispora koreensis TaxID=129052 RepID=UPI0003667A43|nr:TetR/AcrR family transcriptional regulator [Catelliglobosispora koreensis]